MTSKSLSQSRTRGGDAILAKDGGVFSSEIECSLGGGCRAQFVDSAIRTAAFFRYARLSFPISLKWQGSKPRIRVPECRMRPVVIHLTCL